MHIHAALAPLVLGYSPMVDRQRAVIATRLTVFPERPDAAIDAPGLMAALEEVWPATGTAPPPRPLDPGAVSARAADTRPPVSLNVAGEAALQAVMAARPGPQLMIEIPAFIAADPAHLPALKTLREAGSVLLLKGRPLKPLGAEALACFAHSIVDLSDERRTAAEARPGVRQVSTVQAGVRTGADLEGAFKRGAVAALGWTFDDEAPAPSGGRAQVPADLRLVLELIDGVEREEPVRKLEALLKADPTLAYRLMRYLNSPAFGLSVEINSFGHAVMLLGYARLKRWLALLLASSSKDPNAKATLYAAVRRGLLMEELARGHGDAGMDGEMIGEMFICGVFSLLDRLLRQPFAELLVNVPVAERVRLALVGEGGPYLPYLELVRAVESESVFDIRECAERLLLAPGEVNRALLASLRSARQVD